MMSGAVDFVVGRQKQDCITLTQYFFHVVQHTVFVKVNRCH